MRLTTAKKTEKCLILFFEDESELISIYHDIFKMNGYNFVSTNKIEEALQITSLKHPDIVLLDIIIPKPEDTMAEQGWEYLEAVKKDIKTKDIPIVVFTNLDTYQDRAKSEKMGAAAYIFKRDCTPCEVVETVAKIIDCDRKKKVRK